MRNKQLISALMLILCTAVGRSETPATWKEHWVALPPAKFEDEIPRSQIKGTWAEFVVHGPETNPQLAKILDEMLPRLMEKLGFMGATGQFVDRINQEFPIPDFDHPSDWIADLNRSAGKCYVSSNEATLLENLKYVDFFSSRNSEEKLVAKVRDIVIHPLIESAYEPSQKGFKVRIGLLPSIFGVTNDPRFNKTATDALFTNSSNYNGPARFYNNSRYQMHLAEETISFLKSESSESFKITDVKFY